MSDNFDLSVSGAELLHRFASRLAQQATWSDNDAANVSLQHPEDHRLPTGKSDQSIQILDGFGIEFRFLNEGELRQFGLVAATGILVTAVAQGSVAAESGLYDGMVIFEIRRATATPMCDCPSDQRELTHENRWIMQIWGNDGPTTITVVIP